ncbi:unnamed protein product [Camellia sinensis]
MVEPFSEVRLPPSVQSMLQKICIEQCQSPPDTSVRKQLELLGEEVSLEILRKISTHKIYKTLSGFIMHLAKNYARAPTQQGIYQSPHKRSSGASQIESPQRVQALNVLKGKQQQQQRKRKLLLDPQEEMPETHLEDEETKKEKETPLKRMKKMTVFPSDLIGDSTHEAAAKAGEEEHSKEIIVFQRPEKRRQQQVLRDEAAVADALQRKAARRQQITEHYAFRSSPTIATTSETALQRPIIKNGFLQCCKVIEQSNMAISSHLSQAAATIDFYVNICQIAKAAEEKVLKDKEFVSHIHAEVSELKGKHSSASQFQTQLLEKKAQLEEELLAVNLALDRTATKLQITNQGLADRRQDMATTIQLFPSLRSRESIGLYLNSTRTHLQRELRDQIVLIVKFVEETTSCNNWVTGSSNYDVAFNKIAEEGILVGQRRFRFFVFKDGGKEEKKKSPTSSIVKCYFVRMESLAPCDEIESYILSKRTVHEARCLFMHVQMVSSLAKYMARCVVYNEDGDPLIHTDGTGYISEDIALKTPKDFSRAKFINDENFEKSFLDHANCEEKSLELRGSEAHTREPIRLVYNGRAVKGTLLVNRKLPEKTIQVTSSMIKVEADSRPSNVQTFNSLEIVGISLLRCFKPSNPWSRIYSTPNACNTKKPSELSAEELEHELFHLFRRTRFQRSYNMSVAADSWLAFVDQLLILGDRSSVEKDRMKETMHHLIDIYYEALDAPKSGKKVVIPDEIKAEKFPHYLGKPNNKS